MKKFSVLNAAGNVVRTGVCHDEDFEAQASAPGERVVEGHQAWTESATFMSYEGERRAAYPPIVDQLDAIWKGGADLAAMRAQIAAVKDRFPKPS